MNLADIIIPRPKEFMEEGGLVCELEKINWIEADIVFAPAVEKINHTLRELDAGELPYYSHKMNITPRRKILLKKSEKFAREEYELTVKNDWIEILGGDLAGVMHGAESLCQILIFSSQYGGLNRTIPVGKIHDWPRFPYRGIMVDSARHFQKKEKILEILEEMSRYKLNIFHWHLTDRQSWRLPLSFAPELTGNVPHSRAYSYGAYTFEEIREIREYAEARGIEIIPELEMPGHSNSVFYTHKELACQSGEDPYDADYWEFCLGNEEVKVFLRKVLEEMVKLFPNSPVFHIGGDEADTAHWEKCPFCQEKMRTLGTEDPRILEADFMAEMEKILLSLGRKGMTWGKHHGDYKLFSDDMIIQNWLAEDVSTLLTTGKKIVNSFHSKCYFDYPANDCGSDPGFWQKNIYEFDPASNAGQELQKNLLGGEGCLWTEQIPQWRLMPRLLPRMRALSETLWCLPEEKDYRDFLEREMILCNTSCYRYR